jgi:preprotein translocase subunit YajC
MLDGAGSPLLQIVPYVLILGFLYFIILLPTKRKQQKVD